MNTLGWCQNRYLLRITNSDPHRESKAVVKVGICYELQIVTPLGVESWNQNRYFLRITNSDPHRESK